LLRWLLNVGWLGSASMAAYEVPWRGRRIDLVTTNGRGQLTAFEFKMNGTRRVFEQAMYNGISAHRSFVVSAVRPSKEYQDLAKEHGLGLIVVNGKVDLLRRSALRKPDAVLARNLRIKALSRLADHV
jgi:preprotein translocase subunit Sss1